MFANESIAATTYQTSTNLSTTIRQNNSQIILPICMMPSYKMIGGREKTFGDWLRETRTAKGLSGPDLERLSGVSRQYISNLERNLRSPKTGKLIQPSEKTVAALARGLGVSLDEARNAAGFKSIGTKSEDPKVLKLNGYFSQLPDDRQDDVIAITESIWRRHGRQDEPNNINGADDTSQPSKIPPQPEQPPLIEFKGRMSDQEGIPGHLSDAAKKDLLDAMEHARQAKRKKKQQ